ncbi:MAG: hypothetical protein AAF125_13815, partial [Chloroflexota bacterium]
LEALAAQSGRLLEINAAQLPQQIVTVGIDDAIQRRLGHLPEEYRPLLDLAAVAGRAIDQSLLALVRPDADIDNWLRACLGASVLDVNGQQWSFSHDKIRDYVLRGLAPDDATALHQQVAEGIETVYAENLRRYELRLAYHWEHAGEANRAINYLERRAKVALMNFENQEALNYIRKIERLSDVATPPPGPLVRARWQTFAGEAFYAMRMIEESSSHFERALTLLDLNHDNISLTNMLEAARVFQQLVPIYLFEGNWDRAIATISDAAQIYNDLNREAQFSELMQMVPWIYQLRGDFTESLDLFEENIILGEATDAPQMTLNGLAGKALALSRLGTQVYLNTANALIGQALSLLPEDAAFDHSRMLVYAVGSVVRQRRDDLDQANKFAKQGLQLLQKHEPTGFTDIASYASIMETMLYVWAECDATTLPPDYKKTLRGAIKRLHKYAQMMPLARSRAWIYQGWFDRLNGKPERAHKSLALAIYEAQGLGMRYDEAMAFYQMGITPDHPDSTVQLRHAAELFSSLGATWDAEIVQGQLSG